MKALVFLLPLLLTLGACSNIRSKQPVGAEPIDLSQSIGEVQLASIAGEWVRHDGERSLVTIIDPKEGRIRYSSLEEDSEEEEPVDLQLRRSGNHLFLNFEPDEDGERVWLLLKVQGDLNELLYWEPDRDCFRQLIAEGKIPGTNDPSTTTNEAGEEVEAKNPGAVINDPGGAWVEKMVAGEFGVLFDWMNPTVLRRSTAVQPHGEQTGPPSPESGEDPE